MSRFGSIGFGYIALTFLLFAPFSGISSASLQKAPQGIDGKSWNKISAQIRASAYDFSISGNSGKDVFESQNRMQGFLISSDKNGLSVKPRTPTGSGKKVKGKEKWNLQMSLWGYGRGEKITEVASVAPVYEKNRLKYLRDGITEWYVNDRRGVEHGFTLDFSPEGADQSPLTIVVAAETGLRPELLPHRKGVRFVDGSGKALRYDNLHVYDASGKELTASFEEVKKIEGRHLVAIKIDDKDAEYPLTIDPLLYTETEKLVAADGAGNDYMGHSVAASGDIVVVGAKGDATKPGAAYVYYRNQGGADLWGQVKKLVASDGVADDAFGVSVAISGDIIVVGANRDDTSRGAAYIYYRNEGGADNWGQKKKIAASDAVNYDNFGISVGIYSDIIVVGAYKHTVSATDDGAAYLYYRNEGGADNWGEKKKIVASDPATTDNFGNSVSISGDIVVIGASQHNVVVGGNNRGAAYVFYRNEGSVNNWGQKKKLTASDGADSDYFGTSVSVYGNTIVVGAKGDNSNRGAAYVYYRDQGAANQWGEKKKLTASDGASSDNFGTSVSISGDTIVIGASQGMATNQGSAYVFARNEDGADLWGEVTSLTASDGAASDYFGYAVAISGNTIVSGAYYDDIAFTNQGSAYVFHGEGSAWYQACKEYLSDPDVASFGYSVAVSNDVVVVGAYHENLYGAVTEAGVAYVFERNEGGFENWGMVEKLKASNPAIFDHFGYSVAIHGNTILVGAPDTNVDGFSNKGAAYVFQRTLGSWDASGTLTASEGAADDRYGYSVAVYGDTFVIGAPFDDIGANADQGSVYVYNPLLTGGVSKITASDGAASDQFGMSAAISGDFIVVGASAANVGANTDQGAAYVFKRNQGGAENWGLAKKLLASDAAASDQFGIAVALDGDTIAVGAHLNNVTYADQGAAYVFKRNQGGAENWGQVKRITASDGAASDNFGISVSVSGDAVVVGAYHADNGAATNQGAAYLFRRNEAGADNWGLVRKFMDEDGALGDGFGTSVAISGTTVVIGAASDGIGSASIFREVYDLTGPTGTISINSGASLSNSTLVTLTLSCDDSTGCYDMSFSNDGTTWTAAEAFATSRAWDLTTGSGTKTVYVKYADPLGNWSGSFSDTIILDTVLPTGTISINAGAGYSTTDEVTLTLSCADTNGCSQMQFSSTGLSWSTAEAYATSKVYTLSSPDGAKTTYVRYKDNAGNWSISYSDNIILDTFLPTGSISINSGAAWTKSTSVNLTLSCTDATAGCVEMQFSDNGSSWSVVEDYATAKVWSVPAGDGLKKVYAKFKDAAGNWSANYMDTIILDTTSPVTSNSPQGGTYSAAQNVTLTCSDGTGTVSGCAGTYYCMGAGCTPATLYSSAINIATTTTLRFYSKDGADNSETIRSVTYTLDTIAPTGSVSINSGASYVETTSVTLTLSCSDTGGCAYMKFSNDNSTWSEEPYSTIKIWDLASGNGTRTVYVKFRDAVGNWSGNYTDTIVLDTVVPIGTISINGGAAYAGSTSVSLTLTCTDTSGCADMCIKNDSSTCDIFETYSAAKSWTLTPGEATKTVYVTFRDSAGKVATFNDSIDLDLTPPSGTISINSGAATTGSTSATLSLTCTDSWGACSLMQLSDDGIDWDPAEGFNTSRAWTLSGGDGVKYVYVKFSDAAGNWSDPILNPISDFIILDLTGPEIATISLPVFTNSISLDFSVSCWDDSGCSEMQFSNDNSGWSAPEAYSSAKSGWILPPGDGQKAVYARFKDGVGNWSTFLIFDDTKLDTTAPVTTASPAGGTYGAAQSITLSCSDGAGSGCNPTHYCTGTDCTPSSLYIGPINISASATLRFKSEDFVGNIENIRTETYVIDASAPTGTITINSGAAATNSTSVTLALTCTDANGCAQMKFSDDNVGWSVEEGYATTKARTLGSGDGTKTIYVKFKDTVNNWSGAYSDAILLDTAAPVTTASPAGGSYATAQTVTLSCSDTAGSGCGTRYYCTGEGCTPTTLYSSALNISSTTTLRFYSIDGANNNESVKTETYVIDASAPTGTISINSGAVSTNATAVTLALTCADANGCSQMRFSDDNSLWSAAEDYATSKARTLPSGDGAKTIYVKFKDAIGNWSGAYSDSIILDTTAPVTTASPAGGTHGSQQNVELTCNDGSGSGCTDTYYCTGVDCTPGTSFTSSIYIGSSTILRFYSRDGATNNETVRTETYVIDASAPTGTITINSGAAATASTSATLTLTCSDSNGCSHMKFSDDNVSWSVEESYAASKARTLPSGDGAKTVYVKFKDTLGNWSGAYNDSILLDQTAPVSSASPAGGTYSSAQSVTLSCSDGTGSGCNARYYCTGDACAPTTLYSGALNISSTTTLRFYSKDSVNNNETVKTESYVIDGGAPSGSITINSGNAATASTSATLTLTCSDSNGCSHMKFSDDNAGWSVEEGYATTKSRTLGSGDGTKTVYVKFKDTLGNWSGAYSDTILLDMTAPVTTASPAGGTYGSAQSVTLSCSDGSGSGCAGTYYCTGAACAPATPYSGPINVASSTTLRFFSADSLTNSEVIKSADYSIAFTLTVSKTGQGSGNVTVNTGVLQWTGDIGTANYYSVTSVDLTATPVDACSYFNGWTGACSGSESLCTLLMDSSRATSAAFNAHSLVVDNAPNYHSSIQGGYNAAQNGAALKVRGITLTEDLLFNGIKHVRLTGGYDCGYSSNAGAHTTVNGKITIGGAEGGSMTIENITVR
ncbi:MAG: chitobiase/beta-hexosaminidase C-terminal domain-containing protein [Nitrospirae bacterium]|nr:chitobiase/beta-hexosaminidase C-terminal domain-containing protein [Nitrospirota bacterium]